MQSDIIGRVIGDWGPWQLRTVIIIFLCKIPAAWFMACLIFTGPAPNPGEFHCKQPKVASDRNLSEIVHFASPPGDSGDIDQCYMHQNTVERWQNYTENGVDGSFFEYSEAVLVPCEHFIHTGDIRSIVTDFDLVCSRTILVALTQTFHLLGVLIGGIIANQLLYR